LSCAAAGLIVVPESCCVEFWGVAVGATGGIGELC